MVVLYCSDCQTYRSTQSATDYWTKILVETSKHTLYICQYCCCNVSWEKDEKMTKDIQFQMIILCFAFTLSFALLFFLFLFAWIHIWIYFQNLKSNLQTLETGNPHILILTIFIYVLWKFLIRIRIRILNLNRNSKEFKVQLYHWIVSLYFYLVINCNIFYQLSTTTSTSTNSTLIWSQLSNVVYDNVKSLQTIIPIGTHTSVLVNAVLFRCMQFSFVQFCYFWSWWFSGALTAV